MSPLSVPIVDAYIAALPQGLDSYPAFEQKASVFREFVKGLPISLWADRLPEPLATLVTTPPPVNQWVPEVQANAVFLAARAEMFADDGAYERFAYKQNVQLLSSPLYAILFKLVSPERVMRGAASRWAQFHRGMVLSPLDVSGRAATFQLKAPPGLLNSLLARCYATAFKAAVEAAGARDASVTLVSEEGGLFRFQAAWS